jgi:hypothetical protein
MIHTTYVGEMERDHKSPGTRLSTLPTAAYQSSFTFSPTFHEGTTEGFLFSPLSSFHLDSPRNGIPIDFAEGQDEMELQSTLATEVEEAISPLNFNCLGT